MLLTVKEFSILLCQALMVVFLVGIDSFFSFAETFGVRAATLILGICPDKIHLIRLKRDLDQILDMYFAELFL